VKQISFALMIAVTLVQSACGGGTSFPDAGPLPDVMAVIPNTTISPHGRIVRTRPVTLTSDTPATIYYTLDSTEPTTASTSGPSPVTFDLPIGGAIVKYFAVSSTGGTEATKTETLILDRLGPQAIDGFTATATGPDIGLTWTNPTAPGFADVVIVRTPDVAATVPTDGAALAVGEPVGPGTVVYVGNGAAFTHAAAGAGSSTYVAWARFDNGVYAEGRTAAAYVEPATQAATISIDITGKTGTVTTQPTAYTLAIANVSTAVTGKVSFDVTATSTLRGLTFAPKLVQQGLAITDDASIDLVADGTLGTAGVDKVVLLGIALPAGGSITRTVTMNTTGTGVITFDVSIVHSPGAYAPVWGTPSGTTGARFEDLGSTAERQTTPEATTWDNPEKTGEEAQYRGLIVSPDGRWLYAGSRASSKVVKIDTTTGLVVAGAELPLAVAGSRGSVVTELDPSGHRLYVVFNDGMHAGADRATTETLQPTLPTGVSSYFLELDPTTMTEVGRVTLQTDAPPLHVARNFALSRDGRKAAIPEGGSFSDADDAGVAVLDVSAMFVRDGDLATAGVQPVPTPGLRPVRCAFTWAGDRVVCLNSTHNTTGDQVTTIDASTLTATTVDQDGVATTNTAQFKVAVALPDGTVELLGKNAPLLSFAPMTGVFTSAGEGGVVDDAIAAVVQGDHLLARGTNQVFRIDPVSGGTTLVHADSDGCNSHTVAATPF
jgi:hypothetical protein